MIWLSIVLWYNKRPFTQERDLLQNRWKDWSRQTEMDHLQLCGWLSRLMKNSTIASSSMLPVLHPTSSRLGERLSLIAQQIRSMLY